MSDVTPESGAPLGAGNTELACAACGGRMAFDAALGSLSCPFCGATRAVGDEGAERTIVEYDLEHGIAQAATRGYGAPLRTLSCEQCGAVVSYGESATARRCDFCGSPQVLERTENRQPIRPESVMPFAIDRRAATARFSAWLGSLWLRPSSLKKLAQVSEMSGVYVPYWSFDAAVHSDWSALAGHYYYVTETYTARDSKGNGVQRQRSVRKVRWQQARGSRDDVYDDLLVCASRGLPASLTQKLEPFDTARLLPYDASFLAGWKAEEYSLDLNEGWRLAVARIEETQRQRCSGDVPGDTQKDLRVSHRLADERFKHLLLPIWIAAYRYRDQPYQFLVNGQTGEVTGHAPFSVLKVTLVCLLVGALLILFLSLTSR